MSCPKDQPHHRASHVLDVSLIACHKEQQINPGLWSSPPVLLRNRAGVKECFIFEACCLVSTELSLCICLDNYFKLFFSPPRLFPHLSWKKKKNAFKQCFYLYAKSTGTDIPPSNRHPSKQPASLWPHHRDAVSHWKNVRCCSPAW